MSDPRLEAIVQAGWFGPCACPPEDPDSRWRIVSPECVPCGAPEVKAAAILAALDARRREWENRIPKGWYPFGTHVNGGLDGISLVFSDEVGEDGLPEWERLEVQS